MKICGWPKFYSVYNYVRRVRDRELVHDEAMNQINADAQDDTSLESS